MEDDEHEGVVRLQNETLEARKLSTSAIATALQSLPSKIRGLLVIESDLQASTAWCELVPLDLSRLSLCSTGLQNSTALLGLLKRLAALEVLDLSDNFLEVGPEFAGVLGSLSRLSSLNLSGNWLGSEGLMHLSSALKSMSTLQELSLSRTCAEGRGLATLMEVLASSGVNSLDLSYNTLRNGGWEAVLVMIPVMMHLKILNVSGNCLEDAQLLSFLQFTQALQGFRSLKAGENFPSSEVESQLKAAS